MNSNNNDEQLRLIIFVVFCGIILFGWQYFFAPKESLVKTSTEVVSTKTETVAHPETVKVTPDVPTTLPSNSVPGELTTVINGEQKYEISSELSFADIINKQVPFTYRDTIGESGYFQIYLKKDGKIINTHFVLKQKISDDHVILSDSSTATDLDFQLESDGVAKFVMTSAAPIGHGFLIQTSKKELPNRHVREFIVYNGSSVERTTVGKQEDGTDLVKWFGLDFNYHMVSVVFKDKISASYLMNENGSFSIVPTESSTKIEGKIIYTNKNYDKLVALGDNLKLSVDFGILGILTVPILKGLQFFYDIFPNYGISIIILTFLLRLLTFPLQFKSFKSMKKMQEVQPEMNKIREKFKDDPKRLQQETMALFKRVGANPLSGCFPILLQMPIFIAFYKVLSSAMELVGAPFYFWIHDLSAKDPFYVLPVLVTAAFFVQQKMTPTTTVDPTQKKVMMIMPLFFGFIMKDLPAGLNLYMFVSSFLGIFQQLFVYRLRS